MRELINSFKFAFCGILYAIKNERNFRIHLVAIFYVLMVSILVNLSFIEHVVIIFCFAGVISMELLNTAFELICDKDGREYNQIIKYAKDVSAAAVLVYAIAAVLVGLLVYVPKISIIIANLSVFRLCLFVISIPFSLIFIFKGVNK